MGRDILSEFGPDIAGRPKAPALSNTQGRAQRDVMNYQPPYGPSNINDAKGPGIHGVVLMQGTQGASSTTRNNARTMVGLGGDDPTCGTNRKGR